MELESNNWYLCEVKTITSSGKKSLNVLFYNNVCWYFTSTMPAEPSAEWVHITPIHKMIKG